MILDFVLTAEQRFQDLGSGKRTIISATHNGLGPRFKSVSDKHDLTYYLRSL
ncbi:MAG: hypothetical protein QOH21_516 [Acidobacteriota bacterium]|jgi:hypothetical protein|nr:hypothetical protein [Acidobacteriota bacterium]